MYETRRLSLRAHTSDDIPRLLSLYHDAETNSFMSNAYNFPMTRKTLEDVIFAVDAGNKLAVIIEHKESGAFMGSLTMTIQNSKNRDGVVGIALGKEWRSNGYGTEVLTWLVGFAFKELGLHRISLQVFAMNESARAVYEKIGFIEEGRMRRCNWVGGKWDDMILMSILEDEWDIGSGRRKDDT